MPDAKKDSKFFTQPNDSFVSPLAGRGSFVFYSSITIPRSRITGECLRCGIVNMTEDEINSFLLEMAKDESGLFRSPYFDAGGADFSVVLPEIPDLPEV